MWGFYRPLGLCGAVGGFGGINGRFVLHLDGKPLQFGHKAMGWRVANVA